MQEKAKALTSLLNEDAQQAITKLTDILSDWYKTSSVAFIQTAILHKDLGQSHENLELFILRLNDGVEAYQKDLQTLTHGLKTLERSASVDTGYQPRDSEQRSQSTQPKSARKEYVRTFSRGLKELTSVQEEVWTILKENADLVNQFQALTLSILAPDSDHSCENS